MTSQCLGLVSLMRQMSVTLPHLGYFHVLADQLELLISPKLTSSPPHLTSPHLGYSHVLADQLELLQLYPAAAAGVTPPKQCLQPPSHLRYQPIKAQYYTS